MGGFRSSENKDIVRRQWDLPIIRQYSQSVGHRLSYLGMPGPELADLLDWQDFLARERTAVEGYYRNRKSGIDRTVQRQMIANVMSLGPNFSSGFELMRGDVESLILTGRDMDDRKPQCGNGRPGPDGRLFYDLINLDFCGGAGYKTRGGHARRIKAIKTLIARQQGHDFLFLLSLNVRSTIGKELTEYLSDARARYGKENSRFRDLLDWHTGVGQQCLVLKAAIPLFVQQVAEATSFVVKCYPPITYVGTGRARIIHFVFQLAYQQRAELPVYSDRFVPQTPLQVLELPLMEVKKATITLADSQPPGLSESACSQALSFLSEPVRTAILQRRFGSSRPLPEVGRSD